MVVVRRMSPARAGLRSVAWGMWGAFEGAFGDPKGRRAPVNTTEEDRTMRRGRVAVLAVLVGAGLLPASAGAASSKGCEGGGFVLRQLTDGTQVGTTPGGDVRTTSAAGRLGTGEEKGEIGVRRASPESARQERVRERVR